MTGGGTAGHVTPNLALIPELLDRGFEIHYIGRKAGIEKDLIEATGISYHSISAGKLRRYIDLQNLTDLFRIGIGFLTALILLKRIRPQMVFSKGGFVSCPVVWAAWLQGIPVIIHESDLTPGLANRLSIPFATRICHSFPETAKHLPEQKAVHTGIPVRGELLAGDSAQGREICGFTTDKPVLLIIGGSQGSELINQSIRSALSQLLEKYQVCHICGKGGMDGTLRDKAGYQQFEYVDKELPHLFALADLVVSRAGATTLFEILELKKANLLIPLSKKASRGDQIQNAESFAAQGFSHVLSEAELTPENLLSAIDKTFGSKAEMTQQMDSAISINGKQKVLDVLAEVSKGVTKGVKSSLDPFVEN